MTVPFQVACISNVAIRKCRLHILCALQHKCVMTIRGEWISFRQPMVNEDGNLEIVGPRDRDIKSRILVGSNRVSHPIKDELAALIQCWAIQTTRSILQSIRQVTDQLCQAQIS